MTEFDAYRAPPDAAELAKRHAAGLTPRQAELLARWGYPYVLDEFRFHLTLTGPIADAAERTRVAGLLRPLVAPLLGQPMPVRELCLFHQPDRAAPFRLIQRFPSDDEAAGRHRGARGPPGLCHRPIGRRQGQHHRLCARSGSARIVMSSRDATSRGRRTAAARTISPSPGRISSGTARAGRFALSWRGNGLGYGVGTEIDLWLHPAGTSS